MRVAHIITRLILGGAQENTLLNCVDLIERYGDDVLLITGPALGPEGSLLAKAEAKGVPLEVVDSLRRAIRPGRDWAAYRRIVRILRGFAPDVVHTHSAKGGVLGRAAAWKLGIPAVVHTIHGAPFHPYQNTLGRWFCQECERWAERRCHAILSVADAMTDLMLRSDIGTPEKYRTIYSGMEVEPFLRARDQRDRVRGELGYRPEDVVIGKVARFFHLKGHADVIEAAAAVVRANPNVRFLFIGNGILRESLERRIASHGLESHFRFTGLIPPDELPPYFAAMDVLVHASLREGLARVLPQALIAGTPAVSYDIDGAREVVLDGETGRLIPPGDVRALADALTVLCLDADLRARLGAEGRRRFTDVFRHETMTEQIRAVYTNLLLRRTETPR